MSNFDADPNGSLTSCEIILQYHLDSKFSKMSTKRAQRRQILAAVLAET